MKKNFVKPTGDLTIINNSIPATVPVPLPIVFVHVEGPFTALDRKLWVLLLHHAWDELETKSLKNEWHEIHEHELRRLMERFSGTKDISKVWESSKRLGRTLVEYLEVDENKDVWESMSILFQAKRRRKDGFFRFKFPADLVPLIKQPGRFARLRVEFLLGLKSKYAVTLYELFETKANQREPVLEASVEELRQWLKVPDNKLTLWGHLYTKALLPAVEEINANSEVGGITVTHDLMRSGRGGKVIGVKFTIHKTKSRIDFERSLLTQKTAKQNSKIAKLIPPFRGTSVYSKAKKLAPGLDVDFLEGEWRDWVLQQDIEVENPEAHYLAFVRRKALQHGPVKRGSMKK